MKQWTVVGRSGLGALTYDDKTAVPQFGDSDVLVRFYAASINYRDITITKGRYPFHQTDNVVPGSDGAGVVEAVGKSVTRFKKGDRVLTLLNQGHIACCLDVNTILTGLGGMIDGVLRQYGTFNEQGLVHMPSNLNFQAGATLPCAALTAWNCLFGLEGRKLMPGDWVLTEGSGGVSLFTLQFAKAVGAKVISTTSSTEKGEKLKELGADHVLNYKDDENWGQTAKSLTGGVGVRHVVEVGGPKTMRQALNAICIDGVISIIGFLGGIGDKQMNPPGFLDCLLNICTIRGVLVGSRMQFEEMNRAIEANDIVPVVDSEVFHLEDVPKAYEHMIHQRHFGKVVVRIEHEEGSRARM